ncbi:MAG: hypothetical protein KDD43_04510 [Bdellovibrionales bacterium]|nr:hypothetical protein [Bdellovibrionales bacterium]
MGPLTAEIVSFGFWENGLSMTSFKNCRNRLSRLQIEGLVQAVRFNSRKLLFRTTPLGVGALKAYKPELKQVRATSQVTFNIEHAQLVAWTRLKLEKRGEASHWRSERRLISEDRPIQLKRLLGKMKTHIADGTFISPEGKTRLFELEHYPKSLEQRKTRISRLKGLLTYLPDLYQGISFICTSKTVVENYLPMVRGLDAQVIWMGDIFSEGELTYVIKR